MVGDVRNLTGDARLDESLEQAFRISLEQSNYVNVVSDLKVRETLERMQKRPGAQVDRAIGSEVALRDGARALVLPTVAEVGSTVTVNGTGVPSGIASGSISLNVGNNTITTVVTPQILMVNMAAPC